MVKLLKPVIERRLDKADSGVGTRKRKAEDICRFLEVNPKIARDMPLERERFYGACEDLLRDRDSERILLYLPLELLRDALAAFRKAYCDAWYRLLGVRDVRENFHTGDCFELNARPSGGLERVAKCAHLTPWLLKFGYIDWRQVENILNGNSSDMVLLQSFKDTWGHIRKNKILDDAVLSILNSKTAHLPERKKPEPLYVSKKRLEWLDERNKPAELLTPSAKLEGPFSDNILAIKAQLEEIAARLNPSEIVLVGGSQLKGYGTKNSDLDVWSYERLLRNIAFQPGNPHVIHVCFDTIWLGGRDVTMEDLERLSDLISGNYTEWAKIANKLLKRQAVERLESDLLQYRLLHKGFSRFTGQTEFHIPSEMDGDCPFYSDEYRRIATMLYAKYVWL